MLEAIDIRKYLAEYGSSVNEDGSRILESVSCGGESGPKARTCDYGWVLNTHIQCVEYGVPFHFHQTGVRLRRSVPDGHGGHILKIYEIPREYQHTQAEKAGLDYGGGIELVNWKHLHKKGTVLFLLFWLQPKERSHLWMRMDALVPVEQLVLASVMDSPA